MSTLLPRDATPTDLQQLLIRLFPSYSSGITAWTFKGEPMATYDAMLIIEGGVHRGRGNTPWMAWLTLKADLVKSPVWAHVQSEEAARFFEEPHAFSD